MFVAACLFNVRAFQVLIPGAQILARHSVVHPLGMVAAVMLATFELGGGTVDLAKGIGEDSVAPAVVVGDEQVIRGLGVACEDCGGEESSSYTIVS
jgi:hypothetical protein